MALSLNNLSPAKGAQKRKKRVGRGNSSGKGNYSTRGIKGQRARSGGKGGLKRLGLRTVILATPKKKGFKSLKPKNQVVNLGVINKKFKEGEAVNPTTLAEKGLIKKATEPVKILSQGEFTLKGLKVEKVKISQAAEKKIKENQGTIN